MDSIARNCIMKVVRCCPEIKFENYTEHFINLVTIVNEWLQNKNIKTNSFHIPNDIDNKIKRLLHTLVDCLATVVYAVNQGEMWVLQNQGNPDPEKWKINIGEIEEFINKEYVEEEKVESINKFKLLYKHDKPQLFAGNEEEEEWKLMIHWRFWASMAMELFGTNGNKELIWKISSHLEGGEEKFYHRGRNMKIVKGLLKVGQRAHRRDILFEMMRRTKGDYKPTPFKGGRKRKGHDTSAVENNEINNDKISALLAAALKQNAVEEIFNDSASKSPRIDNNFVYQFAPLYVPAPPKEEEVKVDVDSLSKYPKVHVVVRNISLCSHCNRESMTEKYVGLMNPSDVRERYDNIVSISHQCETAGTSVESTQSND